MSELADNRALTAPFLAERPHWFDSARDAIDSVSRFESLTLDNWEYRLEARERADASLQYRVALNNLYSTYRGYLTFVPRTAID